MPPPDETILDICKEMIELSHTPIEGADLFFLFARRIEAANIRERERELDTYRAILRGLKENGGTR